MVIQISQHFTNLTADEEDDENYDEDEPVSAAQLLGHQFEGMCVNVQVYHGYMKD